MNLSKWLVFLNLPQGVSVSNYIQSFLDTQLRDRLSVSDATILHQHLGVSKAANFIEVVDPWCFPDNDTPNAITVKSNLQSVVDKAASVKLSEKMEEGFTEFLLSPYLERKGGRPSFVNQRLNEAHHLQRIDQNSSRKPTVARKPSAPAVDLPTADQG